MRKIICLFLALFACLMLATAASAEATVPTYCQACGKDVTDWKVAPSNWRTLKEGHHHFYLSSSKSDGYYWRTPNTNNTPSSEDSAVPVTICLDLNGFNNTRDGRALSIYKGATVNIMDSSAAQTGYIKSTSGSNATVGGTVYLAGTLNLYGSALKYVNDGTGSNQAYAGSVMAIYSGGIFNMYGGRLEGGKLVSNANSKAGTLYITNTGKANLFGGEILSGILPEGALGPCVFLDKTAQITLSGKANVADIYLDNSDVKLNISGTYSGTARVTLKSTPSNGKVIGSATGTPKITGDLFCTNGNGWLVKAEGSSLKLATFTPNGEWHYCQHCKEVRRWTALTASNYTNPNATVGEHHYYLSGDITTKQIQIKDGASLCFDLYGHTFSSAGRCLLTNGTSTLNLMDTQGGGVVHAIGGDNNPRGTTICVTGKATGNMYSGTVRYTDALSTSTAVTNRYGVVAVGGVFNMYGGTIEGADMATLHTKSYAGAIHMYNSYSKLNFYGGTVTSGKVAKQAPCVEVGITGQQVKLAGNANVENIYFASNNKSLTVSGDYTGTASVTYGTAPALGEEVGSADNARILGKLTCTNGDWLIKAEGSKLVTTINAPVAIIDGETETGYETLQAAVDAYASGYIKLMKNLTENVTVSKDITLDLNGFDITGTVTVAEGATLYGMDNETDDYTVSDDIYGQLNVIGKATGAEGYFPITEDGKISFHKYTVKITDMTLRPAEAGIYYKSSFLGDEKVAPLVESFGVALSVYEIPDAQNMDIACGYTVFTDFQSGANGNASTSSLLTGILKTKNSDQKNTDNLNITIHGRPYLKTADGYIFGETQSRTLMQQMQDIDEAFATLSGGQRHGLMGMYDIFHNILKEVNLPNMAQQKTNDTETLRIMMVGNSFCYYYVEELYGLLMANPDPNRGYSKVEIYNLYYSGCSLTMHYNWWTKNEAHYDLYKTDVNGRAKQTPPTGTAWKLEDALVQGNWDYISLQGASSENNYSGATTEENVAKMIPLATPLLGRFHELFPNAQLLWHRTWPFEIGRVSGSTTYTEELLAKYNTGMQNVCDWMCEEFDKDKPYDLKMVNSGAAWVIVREENAKLETSLIPAEGGLCARLGVRNEKTYPYYTNNANAGDGYHDGDIGGGQFLNACVWYETITGQSVLDNPYKPTTTKGEFEVSGKYQLSDAFANLIRNAAHAVNLEK